MSNSRIRRAAVGLARGAGARLGYTMLQDGAVSPVPQLPSSLADPSWSRRASPVGVQIDLDEQLRFIERHLLPYVVEFSEEVRDKKFELWNTLFQAGDAEALYALVRHLKPERILEIGSGNSTVVTSAACVANAREGVATNFVAVDPAPQRPLGSELEGLTRHEQMDCRDLPFERFEQLRPGDVLFIDTLHVVKRDSEVNWLVLEVLPRLVPDVWVHFHDIFIPYDYPPWLYWLQFPTEQYLLHALLIESPWRVELALTALFLDRHDAMTKLVPSLLEKVPGRPELETWYPSSFWIRKPG
jgi:Methyltransferase domain